MQTTIFYEQLQNSKDLDLRDSRGKLHNLSFILLSLSLALLRRRDGLLSSIHRSMHNKNTELCNFLSIPIVKVVSRSHLPIVLSKVNLPVFEDLLFSNYGIALSQAERSWFAGDGKELRGSILKGNTRGEAVVSLVSHEQRDVLGQSFYSGNKESEKPCFQELLTKTEAAGQKITADALHLSPQTTQTIAEAGGIFMIGLKENQKTLLEDMKTSINYLKPICEEASIEKGHGRIEKRQYKHYDISGEYFEKRWENTKFQSLFTVKRTRWDIQSGNESENTDYWQCIKCKAMTIRINTYLRSDQTI